MKQQFKRICRCGKEIIGFSEHHLKVNLFLHKKISKEHKERMKLNKLGEIVYSRGLNKDEIADLLMKHPIIIEDIKQIGGYYEKEIMVS